jgi:hypothetical protein
MAVYLAFKYYKKCKLYKSTILFKFYSNVTCTIRFFIPPWITITFPISADAFVIAIHITWTVKHCKNNRIGLRFSGKEILSILSNLSSAKLISFFCVSFSGERKIDRIYLLENLGLQTASNRLMQISLLQFFQHFQKHLVYATLSLISSLLQFIG